MAKITITPVVYPSFLRKDGCYSVKVRITCNKKTHYILTNESAKPSQLTKTFAIKDADMQHRLLMLVDKMRQAAAGLDNFTLEHMDIDEIVSYIEKRLGGQFRLDFFSFWELAVQKKPEGTRQYYMYALKSLKKYAGSDSLDISKITSRFLRDYEEWLTDKHGKGARAVSEYTSAIRHVHALARRQYNDDVGEPLIRNPFDFYKPPKQPAAKHRNVDASVIQEMIETRGKLEGLERRAVDAWLLSFALMGMNAPDMLSCAPPVDDILIYNRQKTRDRRADKAELHVRIDERIRPLFDEWAEHDGVHAFIYHRFHIGYRQFNWALASGLASYRKRQGIPDKGLDFYSARHTWASLAYSAGIDKATINDCLCHVDQAMKVTDIYINKDWSVLWRANHRVLEQFNWE